MSTLACSRRRFSHSQQSWRFTLLYNNSKGGPGRPGVSKGLLVRGKCRLQRAHCLATTYHTQQIRVMTD